VGFIWFQVFSYRYHIFIIGQIKKQIDQVDQVASKQASKQASEQASKQANRQASNETSIFRSYNYHLRNDNYHFSDSLVKTKIKMKRRYQLHFSGFQLVSSIFTFIKSLYTMIL